MEGDRSEGQNLQLKEVQRLKKKKKKKKKKKEEEEEEEEEKKNWCGWFYLTNKECAKMYGVSNRT